MNTDVLRIAIQRRWPVLAMVAAATIGLYAWRTAQTPPEAPVAVTQVLILPDHRVPLSWATPVIPPYQSFETKFASIGSSPVLLRAAALARGDAELRSEEYEEPWIEAVRLEGIPAMREKFGDDEAGLDRLADRIRAGLGTRHVSGQQVVEVSARAETELDAVLLSWAVCEAAHQLHDERMRQEVAQARERLAHEIRESRALLTAATFDPLGVAPYERSLVRQQSRLLRQREEKLAEDGMRLQRRLVRNRAGYVGDGVPLRVPPALEAEVEKLADWLAYERSEAEARGRSFSPAHPEMRERALRIGLLATALRRAEERRDFLVEQLHRHALRHERDDIGLDLEVHAERQDWLAEERAEWLAATSRIRAVDARTENHAGRLEDLRDLDRRLRWYEHALTSPVVVLSPAVAAERRPVQGASPVELGLLVVGILTLSTLVLVQGERLHETLHDASGVTDRLGLPLLGVLPRARAASARSDQPIELTEDERYDPIAATLAEHAARGGPRNLTLVSSRAGEGRSAAALGLAASLARRGLRVALVDGDLRAPTLHETLGLPPGNGLSPCIVGADDFAPGDGWSVQATHLDTLHVLASHAVEEGTFTAIDTERVRELVSLLAVDHDFVLFDTPAVERAGDALSIARATDAAFVVAEAFRTPIAAVERTAGMLQDAGVHAAGVLLSHFPFRPEHAFRPVPGETPAVAIFVQILLKGPPDRRDDVDGAQDRDRRSMVRRNPFRTTPDARQDAKVPSEESPRAHARRDGLARNLLLLAHARPVLEALRARGIEPVALKGLGLLLAGPEDRIVDRPMADIDLLVPKDQFAEAEEVLAAEGLTLVPGHQATYQSTSSGAEFEGSAGPVPLRVDLHDEVWYLDAAGLDGFLARTRTVERHGVRSAIPSTEDHLILVATHAVLLHGQLRSKWLDDLAALVTAGPDWDTVVARARASRLDVALFAALSRVTHYRGAAVPERVLTALRPRGRARLRAAVIDRVLSRPETAGTGHALRLLHRRGVSGKLRAVRRHVFPGREFLRRRYGTRSRGWRLRRPVDAFLRGIALVARHVGIGRDSHRAETHR